MLETLITKAWQGIKAAAPKLWRTLQIIPPAIWMIVFAVAFVGGRLLWIKASHPAHLQEITATYGSIRSFYGPAQMNHDGSQFVYVATANDRGRSVFLCDTFTGKKRQIIEDKLGVGGGGWNDDFDVQAGPWSPDDRYFLCCVSNRLMVCSADTNQEQSVIEDKPLTEAVWLTPTEFAYVTDGKNLCTAQRRKDGQWEHKIFLKENVPLTSLAATSSDTVAWLERDGLIRRVDLSEDLEKAGSVAAATNNAAPPPDGLTLWLDASKLQQTNQSPVLELPDSSGGNNDAVWNRHPPVFNGTNSPGALSGRGTIHFGWLDSGTNGTGLKTRLPLGIAGPTPRSMFVVMRHPADRPMMVSMGDTSAHGSLFAVEWSDKLYLPTGWWADNFVSMTSTNWNVLETLYDGAKQKGYVNGVLRASASAMLNTVDKEVEIGFRDATGGTNSKAAEGDFAELLVYDRALNLTERRQVENYLGGKWFGKNPLSSQSPLVWYDTGQGGWTGMAFSKETGAFLLTRTDKGQDSVWRLDTASGPDASPVQVMQAQSIRDVQWAGTDRFAYTGHDQNRSRLVVSDLSGKIKKQLYGRGDFDWFMVSPDESQIFLFGKISEEPARSIWRYDLTTDALRPVISSSDHPSIYSRDVMTSHGSMKMPGGNVNYTIYRPANFDRHKKYPLVLGDTLITDAIYGEPFMTGMAASGACVAVAERRWWPTGIEQWAQNVQGLYDKLKNDPTVDTRRVYLFAASAETQYLSQWVETNPAPWRGLILLNPSGLPDFSKSPRFQSRPKILLDAGGEEHEENSFKRYQLESLNYGVVVEFFTHPGEAHRIVGIDAKLERARELTHFIFEE